MLTTSLLLVVISILFTVFSLFNAYFHLIRPLQQLYTEQLPDDILLNANAFFIANVIFMLVAIAAGCALTYLVAVFSLKPLKIWSQEMENIDQNQLSKRLQTSPAKDEMNRLAKTFNQLLDRLQSAFDREKRFSAAVAHELKTPLTVVKTNIEFLQMEETPSAAEYAETIAVVSKQNERMIQLVQDLTLLSSSGTQKKTECIDMDFIIEEIKNDLSVPLSAKNIRFSCNRAGCQITGNTVLLKHALLNLIENAVKYNVTDGEIVIHQEIKDNLYTFTVTDSGIGIKTEDIPYIFEPFYRADKSRNRATGGSGLGLAITKEIIEGHGGSIKYLAGEPQGSIFIISLPIHNN